MNGVRETWPVRKIVKIITTHPGRPGAAVVANDGAAEPGDVVLDLTPAGRVRARSQTST